METKLQKKCDNCRYYIMGMFNDDKKPRCVHKKHVGIIDHDSCCYDHEGIANSENVINVFYDLYKLIDDLADYVGLTVIKKRYPNTFDR